jgi:iduronate 2-sulfatase
MLRLLLFVFTALLASSPAADRPNVLLICVDDLKPVAGCYGGAAKTPNLDKLAQRSVRFERAFCNQAVCAPSRNSLMTGLRPQTLGIYDLGTNFRKARPDAVTLAQSFQRAGYRTEAMGKIFHVGHGNQEDPASWSVPHWKAEVIAYVNAQNRAKQGLTREEALFSNKSPEKLPRGEAYESADVPDHRYPDGALANEAARRLKEAKERGGPFFMAVGFVKPHLPFCAPKKYWDLYDPASFALPARQTAPDGAPPFAPTSWGELRQYAGMPEHGPLTDEQARTLIHGYHAATSYMDAQLGRVLEALEKEGLAEKTIIVFWGDHGWHLGDHGQWCKHSNYEEAARIPLLIATPGGKSSVSQSLVETVDLYPTLCELAGIESPAGLDGKSFAAVLKDSAAPTKGHIFHVYPRGERLGRAVRTARHRLVEWKVPGAPSESAVLELYDYQADSQETKNLASEQPSVVAELRAILAKEAEARPQFKAARPDGSKPAADRGAMFDRRDKDKDGKLTREEFLLNQPDPDKAPARFPLFDTNKDGTLSREEFIKSEMSSAPSARDAPHARRVQKNSPADARACRRRRVRRSRD